MSARDLWKLSPCRSPASCPTAPWSEAAWARPGASATVPADTGKVQVPEASDTQMCWLPESFGELSQTQIPVFLPELADKSLLLGEVVKASELWEVYNSQMQTLYQGSEDLELYIAFSKCRGPFLGAKPKPHRGGWPPEPLVQCREVEGGRLNEELEA